jgi:hypothetical protein
MQHPETTAEATGLAGEVRQAVREELDQVLPHLLGALKRDRAFDALAARLQETERRLEAHRERPMAVAVHRVLCRLRRLAFDGDARTALDAELVKVLAEAGFEEFGAVGEPFDPVRHEALSGEAQDGRAVVVELYATGLGCFGQVVTAAQVRVGAEAPSSKEVSPA